MSGSAWESPTARSVRNRLAALGTGLLVVLLFAGQRIHLPIHGSGDGTKASL